MRDIPERRGFNEDTKARGSCATSISFGKPRPSSLAWAVFVRKLGASPFCRPARMALAMLLVGSMAVAARESAPTMDELEAAAESVPTEDLVTDAKRYVESGMAMQLDAIDGLIGETQAQARRGVTDAQLKCLRTFLAKVREQRRRIEESRALKTTGRVGAPMIDLIGLTDKQRQRELSKDIVLLSVSVSQHLTVGHNNMSRCLAGR